jgi:hypothetical protein
MKSIFFSKNLKKPKHYASAKPKTDVIAIIKMDILIKCQLILEKSKWWYYWWIIASLNDKREGEWGSSGIEHTCTSGYWVGWTNWMETSDS